MQSNNTFPAMSEKGVLGSVSDNLQFIEHRFFVCFCRVVCLFVCLYSLNFKYGAGVPNIWSSYPCYKVILCLLSSTPNENGAVLAGGSDR